MTGTQRMKVETTETPHVVQGGRRRVEHLALLTIAMVMGVIGFAFVVFWGIALILMGILWGMMVMDRQRYVESDKGVLAEMVDVVVDAAKDAARIGSRDDAHDAHDAQDEPPRQVAEPRSVRRVASWPRKDAARSPSPVTTVERPQPGGRSVRVQPDPARSAPHEEPAERPSPEF